MVKATQGLCVDGVAADYGAIPSPGADGVSFHPSLSQSREKDVKGRDNTLGFAVIQKRDFAAGGERHRCPATTERILYYPTSLFTQPVPILPPRKQQRRKEIKTHTTICMYFASTR